MRFHCWQEQNQTNKRKKRTHTHKKKEALCFFSFSPASFKSNNPIDPIVSFSTVVPSAPKWTRGTRVEKYYFFDFAVGRHVHAVSQIVSNMVSDESVRCCLAVRYKAVQLSCLLPSLTFCFSATNKSLHKYFVSSRGRCSNRHVLFLRSNRIETNHTHTVVLDRKRTWPANPSFWSSVVIWYWQAVVYFSHPFPVGPKSLIEVECLYVCLFLFFVSSFAFWWIETYPVLEIVSNLLLSFVCGRPSLTHSLWFDPPLLFCCVYAFVSSLPLSTLSFPNYSTDLFPSSAHSRSVTVYLFVIVLSPHHHHRFIRLPGQWHHIRTIGWQEVKKINLFSRPANGGKARMIAYTLFPRIHFVVIGWIFGFGVWSSQNKLQHFQEQQASQLMKSLCENRGCKSVMDQTRGVLRVLSLFFAAYKSHLHVVSIGSSWWSVKYCTLTSSKVTW